MLIGNTILGLAKLTRLMRLASAKHNQAGERANASDLLKHITDARVQKPARKRKITLHGEDSSVPEWLATFISIGFKDYMRAANSNAVKDASNQVANNSNFSARIAAQKAAENTTTFTK